MEGELTALGISATPRRVGRKQINHEQTPARFADGTLARIDAALEGKEKRSDFIRVAVERELDRRERKKPAVEPPAEPSAKPFRLKLEQASYPVDWEREEWERTEPFESAPIPIASDDGDSFWNELLGFTPSIAQRFEEQGFMAWAVENIPSASFIKEWYQVEGKGGTDRCRFWLEIPNNAEAMLFSLRWKLPKDSSSDA
ncbi:UNVERIFIED_ORG: hypothetical protein M2438_002514 [Methylobacterium sp. SuP10 SLI 274]|uniref:hypothetical protein n=1 Tax=Methylorubrum extorquens TaxID=408 RepID=UPI00209C7597|nr:hypothetical protein [Methylorubrum extorquens]MDF9863739.1 hypothetical protein [Methylorubrum pseudosasae]MDH6637339.1 hypothetical protein [Methylobacterium sp. SuP10 SLI 274]MDH6666519.1 hypothetical protein [Methylorubrum zatmanii]MCP1558430.1 hypothetical protein [Methylorubrum extorquens]MDF9792050.1 hypothetical protein [Methylorubrum extorquens]